MPNDVVKAMAKKSDKSVEKAEELWDKAKEQAAEQGHEEEYDYIMGIFKRMMGLDEAHDRTAKQNNAPFMIYTRDRNKDQIVQAIKDIGISMRDWGERMYNGVETGDIWVDIDPDSKEGKKLARALEKVDVEYEMNEGEFLGFKEFLRERRLNKFVQDD